MALAVAASLDGAARAGRVPERRHRRHRRPDGRRRRPRRYDDARRGRGPLGVDLEASLADNDAYHALDRLGDLVRTGPTDTNVGDLQVLVIGDPAPPSA